MADWWREAMPILQQLIQAILPRPSAPALACDLEIAKPWREYTDGVSRIRPGL